MSRAVLKETNIELPEVIPRMDRRYESGNAHTWSTGKCSSPGLFDSIDKWVQCTGDRLWVLRDGSMEKFVSNSSFETSKSTERYIIVPSKAKQL